MRQSDIYGLPVDADPWESPHVQEQHRHSWHTAQWPDFCTPQDSWRWHFPSPLFRLQWHVVQWFPELAMGVLTSDNSWNSFFLWIGQIMSFNDVNFDIHNAVWQWFPILSIPCFEIFPLFTLTLPPGNFFWHFYVLYNFVYWSLCSYPPSHSLSEES